MLELDIYALFRFAAEDLFGGREAPEWLSEHPAIKDKTNINKIFPKIGIKNFKEPAQVDVKHVVDLHIAEHAVYIIFVQIRGLRDRLSWANNHNETQEKYVKKHEILKFLESFRNNEGAAKTIEVQPDGRVKLLSTVDVVGPNNKAVIRSGESLFRSYGKVKALTDEICREYQIHPLPVLDNITAIKDFNKSNIPIGKTYIVFSSEGEGAWNLATMSMRGISSCQSWEGEYKSCLIGSVASKYVGIIYLTSGSDYEGRGEKMIKRCIVRFGVDLKTRKPVIIIDKMYDSFSKGVAEAFTSSIQSKTNIPVLDYASYGHGVEVPDPSTIVIPYENEERQGIGEGERSYMDTTFHRRQKSKTKTELNFYDLSAKIFSVSNKIAERVVRQTTAPIISGMSVFAMINILSDFIRNLGWPTIAKLYNEKKIRNTKLTKRMFLIKAYDATPEDLGIAAGKALDSAGMRNDWRRDNYRKALLSAWNRMQKEIIVEFEEGGDLE